MNKSDIQYLAKNILEDAGANVEFGSRILVLKVNLEWCIDELSKGSNYSFIVSIRLISIRVNKRSARAMLIIRGDELVLAFRVPVI